MTPATTLKAQDHFDQLGEESEQELREIEIVKTPALEEMLKGFSKLIRFGNSRTIDMNSDSFYEACGLIRPDSYEANDIRNFSILLKQFQKEDMRIIKNCAGSYLSNLINYCPTQEEKFSVLTTHLDGEVKNLGYRNCKTINVIGNVGDNAGCGMAAGKLIISGKAGDYLGYEMEEGNIVASEAGDYLGMGMKSGSIVIKGNAGWGIGDGARGGEIHVDGKIRAILNDLGGNIYHKGKLIVKNGRKLI